MTPSSPKSTSRQKQLLQTLRRERRGREQLELDLRRCRDRKEAMLQELDDVAFVADAGGILLEISASVRRMFGCSPQDCIGKPLWMFFRMEEQKSEFLQKLQREKHLKYFEFEARIPPGQSRSCAIQATLFDGPGEDAGAFSGLIRDVTSHKKFERQLSDSREQLHQSQKMEALGTLVAGVAHEINNPINLIMYNLPLLKKIWSDLLPAIEKVGGDRSAKFGGLTVDFLQHNLDQMLSDMFMAANRVTKIISDLKNFARRSSVSDKQPIDVNDAVRNAIRLVQTTLRNSGVQAEVQLQDSLPLMKGNLQNIEQILLNIIINAAQAIDHDHGGIRIETGLDETNGQLRIAVSDNGKGVAPEMADRLFDPFVTDKQTEGGTGLGLSVSYSLVRAHDGDIRFDSRTGHGTTFRLYFPTIDTGRRAKILVVDDDPSIRRLLNRALTRRRSYLVEEAVNGIEACIKLGTYRPEVLVLDVFMPDMDGVEVCRAIRKDAELADLNVIITTGHPQAPKLGEVKRLGFTNILAKPFDIADFMELIDGILTD